MIVIQYNHSKAVYGTPYSSTKGMEPVLGVIAVLIVVYLIFRVWLAIRKDKIRYRRTIAKFKVITRRKFNRQRKTINTGNATSNFH